jgi:hypothetical protein
MSFGEAIGSRPAEDAASQEATDASDTATGIDGEHGGSGRKRASSIRSSIRAVLVVSDTCQIIVG